ncbi:hypothetical protein KFE25_014314 [Diacronema lutheri]|uniref:Aspartyl/asparaginy/proline hydroxylase domain-containing protein n=2 Tax=Diacronema lutheri TaxID=2081491 RepID=A0A8J5XA02_DIALT|nr:hypothetical protein KFE25_014314 [Diacronema lutheri]
MAARATIVSSAILTLGRHRQRPTLFYVPSLRAAPVWSVADLPEPHRAPLYALEAAAPEILAEYDVLRADVSSDYSTADPTRQEGEHRLHEGEWSWHSYVKKGERNAAWAARCPTTASLLEAVPGLMAHAGAADPFGFAFFSTLHPGSTIEPHTAPCNLRLRCHLPLRVPPGDGCAMELAGARQPWAEGKLLVFDDCYEHAVWNRTAEPRVLLLFDLWHPDLAESERAAVRDMFARARAERGAR